MSGQIDNGRGLAFVMENHMPSAWDVYRHLEQESQRKKAIAEQKNKETQAHESALLSYMSKEWDDKEIDGVLHGQLQEKKNYYAGLIQKNKGMSLTDLSLAMQKDLAKLSQWNQQVKTGHDLIKAQAEDYKKYDSIKHNRAAQIATEKMLYDMDEKGNKILRKNIDLKRDYFDEALEAFPTELLKNKPSMNDYAKGATTSKVGQQYKVTDAKGGYVDKEYDAELYPWQEIKRDKTGEVSIVTKGDELKVGKEVWKLASKENYDEFVSKRDRKMYVNGEFKKREAERVAQGGTPLDPSSEEAEVVKRKIVYEMLDDQAIPKSLKPKLIQKAAPAPKTTVTVVNTTGDEKPKAETFSAGKYLQAALKGNTVDSEASDFTVGGKTFKNILPALGGSSFKTVTNNGTQITPTRIIYDPKNRQKGLRVFYDKSETEKDLFFDVSAAAFPTWLKRTARVGHKDFTKVDAEVDGLLNPGATPMSKAINKVRTTTSTRY